MSVLNRQEQQQIVTRFERDYGTLVMKRNHTTVSEPEFTTKVQSLAKQVHSTAKPNYFEEDLLDYLNEFVTFIQNRAHP